jgi:hypothetical protein
VSEPERHHYLPIFYLNGWAGADGKITRYYRPFRDVVSHPIAPVNTGYENGLYRLEGYPVEVRNAVEKDYMAKVVDGPAADALRLLLSGGYGEMPPPLQIAWTRFLLSLFFRTPRMVNTIIQEAARNLRSSLEQNPEEYENVRTENHPPTLVEFVERATPHLLTEVGKSFLPGIIDNQKLGNAILGMAWSVWTLHDGRVPDLLTGDSPICTSHGVGDQRCVIYLPIGPRKAFFASRERRTLNHVFSHGPAQVAKNLNATIVHQAERYVFGSSASHLRFVENRLRRGG